MLSSKTSSLEHMKLTDAAIGSVLKEKVFLEISQNSHENTCNRVQACNVIRKETLAQVFSCEFCEVFKNTFTEHLWWLLLNWWNQRRFSHAFHEVKGLSDAPITEASIKNKVPFKIFLILQENAYVWSFFDKVTGLTFLEHLGTTANDCNGSCHDNIFRKAVSGDYSH